MKRLILASSSPRRYELLKATGLPFEVARPDIDESAYPGEPATDYVLRLSREKANAIPGDERSLILSADTTVADGPQILGKPTDPADAEAMLRQLCGRVHQAHTGVTVRDGAKNLSVTRLTTSQVALRVFTDAEIAAYIASGDPMGKAGAYGIQNTEWRPVDRLEGCYTNVVGLPMCTVAALLAEMGLPLTQPIDCSPTRLPCRYRPLAADQ